jgi:transposase-like protein
VDYEIENVEMEDEFKVCPLCGYEDGFHSTFRKKGGITKWLFICPSCHKIFDLGFTV